MQFIGLYLMWTFVLILAWKGPRAIAVTSFVSALVLNLALFAQHATTRLTLSF